MDINERLEQLRVERDGLQGVAEDLYVRAENTDKQAALLTERIGGIEEALRLLCPPPMLGEPLPYTTNGEAKPPRRPRRDIRGLVKAAMADGHKPDAALLAAQLNCRVSQVKAAIMALNISQIMSYETPE